MKKNISRNPLWPDWYNGKKIDEVQFGRAFLEQWPLKCVNGTLYTLDGPVEDESEIKQRILENIEEYVTSGLSKKVTNILETIKLLAFSDPFPIEQDCIHLQNGVYHLPDGSFQESRLFCQNRLPVKYDPKAASPDRWLTFLHELLDDADIPTLQEYLGYCLIPSTKGQKMMLIVGKGGEGKSRIGLVLKRLMGDAASNGSVQKVENNRFARADLERRLLMIDDDMDMNALPKTNYIKTIYESPIRHFKVQKVQGACHQPHRSPQRAHQGAVRQQPGHRHEPEPLQPSSGAAAGQVPGRSRPHDSRRPLPCPQGQRAGGRGSCHRQPGVFQG